jgi:hypothetical protein
MKARLGPSWELTTESAASSYGQPVLVNRATGEAFGPGDVVRFGPSLGFVLAADIVRRLARTERLGKPEAALVARFVGLGAAVE